jgi:Domain of unknown function (DUF4382)
MSDLRKISRAVIPLLFLASSLFVSSCGGGGGSTDTNQSAQPTPVSNVGNVGKVGLLLTDKPSDDMSEINLDVTEAILIGDSGQHTLFTGSKRINLLDLTNYSEPISFGEVPAGVYTKLRLRIDNLELVLKETGEKIYPRLPANGKVDLLDPGGFPVFPGRTMLLEIDMDANKSIHIVSAGNRGQYQFRPVVKVNVMDGGLPDKLARLEGTVAEILADPVGSFLLCSLDDPDMCLVINTDETTSLFDAEGLPTTLDLLAVDDQVVVIGRYSHENDDDGDSDSDSDADSDSDSDNGPVGDSDGDIDSDADSDLDSDGDSDDDTDSDSDSGRDDANIQLDAIVIEIGGTATQLKGQAVSDPVDGSFLLLDGEDNQYTVELQDGTRYFGPDGELGEDAIVIGASLEIEGVIPAKADPADPDVIRAALVFIAADEDVQLSGTIKAPLDTTTSSFILATDTGDVCVNVQEEADILLVSGVSSTVTVGSFADLALDQVVDVFGAMDDTGGCLLANEVIVTVD